MRIVKTAAIVTVIGSLTIVAGCGSSSRDDYPYADRFQQDQSVERVEVTVKDEAAQEIADEMFWDRMERQQRRQFKKWNKTHDEVSDTIGNFRKEPVFSFSKRREAKKNGGMKVWKWGDD